MKLGFIKSDFTNEQRVPLLPKDIKDFQNELYIETGFGESLNIPDQAYRDKNVTVLNRKDIFKTCDGIFSLKLIQPNDYPLIKNGQIIIGWTHPKGSGQSFMKNQAIPKELIPELATASSSKDLIDKLGEARLLDSTERHNSGEEAKRN